MQTQLAREIAKKKYKPINVNFGTRKMKKNLLSMM